MVLGRLFLRIVGIFVFFLLLSACANERLAQDDEIKVQTTLIDDGEFIDHFLEKPVFENARYALRISERYKFLGDQAATNRDFTSAALIALAGFAAYGTSAGFAAEELAAGAVVGTAVHQGSKYVNPNSVAESFYLASEDMSCVGTSIAEVIGDTEIRDVAAAAVSMRHIRKVELRLRADLERQIPNPQDLADAFSSLEDLSDPSTQASLANRLNTKLQECERQVSEPEN